ncbi:MAG TPA: porin [Woeseiaceae bacterium]|nr:porin [Woeseiaceae bacterium]
MDKRVTMSPRQAYRAILRTSPVFVTLLVAAPVFAGNVAGMGEAAPQQAVPATPVAESNRRTLLENLQNPDSRPLRSLLIEQEMPLVGISWGAQVQFDVPLNGEPEGADPTFREARLTFYRAFGSHMFGKATANYNSAGQFEIGDSYFVYTGWKTLQITAGLFRPPYSLETQSKRAGLTFMERALPVAALSERRSAGISLLKRTPNAIIDMGWYFYSPDDQGQQEKGQALVLRYVHAPLGSSHDRGFFDGRDIWAGVSLSYRTNASGPDTRFRSLPEIGVTDDYFVDTGTIDGADRIYRAGLEASKVDGPFSWQAELLAAKVERDDARSVHFTGGYVLASWFLTGESRNYSPASGEFLTVKPDAPVGKGNWGAWEVAIRASTVNLSDRDVVGGRQRNLTAGLNWYLNARLRMQANLIKVLDVKRPGSPFDGENPWITALRLQWYLP